MDEELEIKEALQRRDITFIDVRSPGEYAEASIPGAVNIPLFRDEERARLGLIYHGEGETLARRAALAMVAPRLPALVDDVVRATEERIPLLYCWRGGLRSASLFHILHLAGVRSYRLKGGYKAYRRFVNRRLTDHQLKSKVIVLHGLTGVGKTAVLQKLIDWGLPAIDLEGLANHRGSVFGSVGLGKPRSQKDFEGLLLRELDRFGDVSHLVVEGEGRRIGNIHLPPFLVAAMESGDHILLTAPMAERVRRIVGEYLQGNPSEEELEQIKQAVISLRWRLGTTRTEVLLQNLTAGNFAAAAEILCREYYDRLYGDAKPGTHNFKTIIDATDTARAAAQIAELLRKQIPGGKIPEKGVL